MSAFDLSVVIVSYNTRDLLDRCLASLGPAAAPLAWEVIVVDNGSHDGSAEMVRNRYPAAVLCLSEVNSGFAHGVNAGIARAHGATLVWLNSDCVAAPGSLAALHRYLEEHHEVGAVGPRLVYPDGRLQPSAQAFPSPLRMAYHFLGLRHVATLPVLRPLWKRASPLLGRMSRLYLEALNPDERPRRVDWVSGACLASRSEFARRVGPLDDGYFMYCEDTDWCHRIHEVGYEVHFLPSVTVTHHVGGSGSRDPEITFQYYRSLLRYFGRHRPRQHGMLRILMGAGFVLRGTGRELARLFGRRDPHPWWRLAASCWNPPAPCERRP